MSRTGCARDGSGGRTRRIADYRSGGARSGGDFHVFRDFRNALSTVAGRQAERARACEKSTGGCYFVYLADAGRGARGPRLGRVGRRLKGRSARRSPCGRCALRRRRCGVGGRQRTARSPRPAAAAASRPPYWPRCERSRRPLTITLCAAHGASAQRFATSLLSICDFLNLC